MNRKESYPGESSRSLYPRRDQIDHRLTQTANWIIGAETGRKSTVKVYISDDIAGNGLAPNTVGLANENEIWLKRAQAQPGGR